MGAYIAKRLLLMIPTLLGMMILTFVIVQFVPGGPIERIIATLPSGASESRDWRERPWPQIAGANQPLSRRGRAVRVGAYDYLTKPFSLGQLDVILSRICDRAGLQLENRQLLERQAPVPPRPSPVPGLVPPFVAPAASVETRLTDVEGSLQRIEAMLKSMRR